MMTEDQSKTQSGDTAENADEATTNESATGTGKSWVVNPGESKVVELDDVAKLKVSLVRGRVDVIGSDEPVTRVEVSNVAGRPVTIALDADGGLTVHHPKDSTKIEVRSFGEGMRLLRSIFGNKANGGNAGGEPIPGVAGANTPSADVSIVLPRAVKAKINVIRGDALVSGLTGGAKLDTVSGTVLSDALTGPLKLDTVSGRVEARNHRGPIVVNSVSGEVVLSGACEAVKVDSVSGDAYLDLTGAPSEVRINAVSGGAVVRVDGDVLTTYDVNTLSGKVTVDGNRFKVPRKGFAYEDGPEDGPRVDVRFNAVSGGLTVVHRAPEAASEPEAEE